MFYTRTGIVSGKHAGAGMGIFSPHEALLRQRLEMVPPEFPRDEAASHEIERRLQERGIQDFVILNPGAGWGAKRWPEERYGEVARELGKSGIAILINYGPNEARLAKARPGGAVPAKAAGGSTSQLHRRLAGRAGYRGTPLPHPPRRWEFPWLRSSAPRTPRATAHSRPATWFCETPPASPLMYATPSRNKDCCRSRRPRSLPQRANCWGVKLASWSSFARRTRVPLGFVFAAIYMGLAKPTLASMLFGLAVTIPGPWPARCASGHGESVRMKQTSTQMSISCNPLYLGSLIIACGFAVASRNWWIVAGIAGAGFAIEIPSLVPKNVFCADNFQSLRITDPSAGASASSDRFQAQGAFSLATVSQAPRVQRAHRRRYHCRSLVREATLDQMTIRDCVILRIARRSLADEQTSLSACLRCVRAPWLSLLSWASRKKLKNWAGNVEYGTEQLDSAASLENR